MNYNNKRSWSYSPFPWLEGKLKNYELNTDYKVEYIDDCKHYTILSDRLKRVMEEEWHQKINLGNKYDGIYPLSWEILEKEFVEGEDYTVKMENGFREVKIHSERLKKAWQNWEERRKQKFPRTHADEMADAILNLFTNGRVKSWDDPGKGSWKNTPKQRQEVINENNPPQFFQVGIKREKYAEWIKQQPPLTPAELAALNSPILNGKDSLDRNFAGLVELNSCFWWIQKVRQANSEVFSDKHFAWHENFEKNLDNPQSNDYRAVQALKKAGISLDRLFERVKRGRQIRKIKEREKPQRDKEKILANIQDWEIRGECIYNPKTGHWKSDKNNFWTGGEERYSYFNVYDKVRLTPETYPEIRKIIFENFLKNLWESNRQDFPKKKWDGKEYCESDFSPSEREAIIKLCREKAITPPFSSSPATPAGSETPNNYYQYYLVGGIIVSLVLVGGAILLKFRNRKNKKR